MCRIELVLIMYLCDDDYNARFRLLKMFQEKSVKDKKSSIKTSLNMQDKCAF